MVVRIKDFVESIVANAALNECVVGVDALSEGSSYARGLANSSLINSIVRSEKVVSIAREILSAKGSLGLVSLTALTVQPGSAGMPKHRDYPHFHPDCSNERPLVAQFVLSLDGTFDGAAPTWLDDPDNVVELEVGELLAFAGNVHHGVLPNTATRSRTNLLWSVGPSWIKPMQASLWDKTFDERSIKEMLET